MNLVLHKVELLSLSMTGTSDPIKILSNIFISFIGAGVLGKEINTFTILLLQLNI